MAPMDMNKLMRLENDEGVEKMLRIYRRNQQSVPRGLASSIPTLSDQLCAALVSLEPSNAATRRASFTHFNHEMDVAYAGYYYIKQSPPTDSVPRDSLSYQRKWQNKVAEYHSHLEDQVKRISGVFENYERDDIPRATKMTMLDQDKNTIREIWKVCVYTNLEVIFLMKGYNDCTLPYENAKTALGSSLHKVLKHDTEQMENDTTQQLEDDTIKQTVNRISTLEEASKVSKKIENALLIWKRKIEKSQSEPTKQQKYEKSIKRAKKMLFELKYRFPSWKANIGSQFVDRNLHVGFAFVEAYSRAVEKLASKANELIDAARQTQG